MSLEPKADNAPAVMTPETADPPDVEIGAVQPEASTIAPGVNDEGLSSSAPPTADDPPATTDRSASRASNAPFAAREGSEAPIVQPSTPNEPAQLSAVPDAIEGAAELLKRVAELEGTITVFQADRSQQLERQRTDLLVSQWGIKEQYLKFAPGVTAADPTTEEGRAALTAWREAHRELFSKAPELRPAEADKAPAAGQTRFSGKGSTWRSLFGG